MIALATSLVEKHIASTGKLPTATSVKQRTEGYCAIAIKASDANISKDFSQPASMVSVAF